MHYLTSIPKYMKRNICDVYKRRQEWKERVDAKLIDATSSYPNYPENKRDVACWYR
jgi:hypothetical protein